MSNRSARARDLATAGLASVLTALAISGGGLAAELAAPKNEKPPTISGSRHVGNTLTANPGTWSGTQPIAFSYQWVRCNSQLANCSNRSTSRRYRLDPDDLGRRLIVVVTARNADGSAQAQANTGVIQGPATAPSNTSAPTIAGTPQEGQTLTANPGAWSGTQPITFTYQWQRCDSNGGNCGGISGATSRTYTPVAADVGRSARVAVRARNSGGTRSASSAPTSAIRAGAPPQPGGAIKLPDGKTSIPIESVSLPNRLVIDDVRFSPNPVRSRTRPFTIRVHVSDTRGFVVRGALVYARSTPLLTTAPAEQATQLDGWVTLQTTPRRSQAGLVFPLRRGLNVQFYVQARKAGERLLYGVAGTRLTQVHTAAP
jgi:predicted actin-binding protein